MKARATSLAILGLLLLAACGDGGEQATPARDGGAEASDVELRQIQLALERLDARIARLETETDELLELLGDDPTLLRDLPALLEDLERRRALLEVVAEGLLELPSPTPTPTGQ